MQHSKLLEASSRAQHTASEIPFSDYRAEVGTSFTGLESEWLALERRAPNATVFQSLAWCRAWMEASDQAGASQDIRLVTVWSGGRIALFWPLAVRRLGPCKILHALAEPATQYCDALVDPAGDRDRLIEAAWALIRSWADIDLVELRRVRDDAAIASLPVIAGGRSAAANPDAAPFVDIRVAGGAAHRSSRTRNALRRHQRKLAEHGPVAFEAIRDPDNKARVVSEAITFKRRWMKERGLWSAGYFHAAADEFTHLLSRRDEFTVFRLTVGGTTAAVEAGFVMGDRYWSLMQSYDGRFASHAPGRLLMWHFIDHCSQVGIDWLDFLAPAHAHKRDWSTSEMPVRDYLIALTVKGSVLPRALKMGRPTLRRLYGLLPAAAQRGAARIVKII
jgi:CelD/BcsL family acetyltransferase involved in cellulose biosynthesis